MLRKLMGGLAATALALTGTLVTAPVAVAADHGDGSVDCNYGEICLLYLEHSEWQSHFWYSAWHGGGRTFYDTGDYYSTDVLLLNNASAIRNRDSECGVWVIDYVPGVNDLDWVDNGAWRPFDPEVWDQNDEHRRCSL